MKNRKIYLMGACLLCGLTSIAQNVSLQPPPQQLNEQGKTLSLPAIYRIAVSYTHLTLPTNREV